MVVRVIEKGPSKEVEKKKACSNCGAILGYVPRDVRKISGRDIGGGPDGCEYIVCPECQDRVVIRSW